MKKVESIDKQIEIHKEKIDKFVHEKPWLKEYWEKQIESFEKEKRKKKYKLKG